MKALIVALSLATGWHIQPTQSTAVFPAVVPSTVVGTLVDDGYLPDPGFGMNLRSYPGMDYPIGLNFSHFEMSDSSPFKKSWWYRNRFYLPETFRNRRVWLHLDGVNSSANVWLNGMKLGDSKDIRGTFRRFELDATKAAVAGGTNELDIEVFAPGVNDLAITWVDWNPAPPDKNMGLWRPVYLTASGPVRVRAPQVTTILDLPALNRAHVTVSTELHNDSDRPVSGWLAGDIEGRRFRKRVSLKSGEVRGVRFKPMIFDHPKLWWPYQMGPQNLHRLKLVFVTGGRVSDGAVQRFGIKQVTSELDAKGHRLFRVNGRRFFVRGGGWAPDFLLRASPERQNTELNYVRDLGLNTIRMEGKIESDHFFDLADEKGIMVIAGWCCCDHWEDWDNWKSDEGLIAVASLKDQLTRLRNHPSVLAWLYGSDNPPPENVERAYLKAVHETHWPDPTLSSASATPTTVTGPSGVKMTGPYDYVAPEYWSADKTRGGAYGFNTETSPGPAIPPLESLKKMIPADHLWPVDYVWNFHAGGTEFSNVILFKQALDNRYGESRGVEEFVRKSQAQAYEGERAMFEAYSRNKYTESTGIVQWMLNNAWPSIIWHLYDYYLRPGGSYFGAKKANEPLHIQYSYDDRSVVVVNQLKTKFSGLKAHVEVLNSDSTLMFARDTNVDVGSDGVRTALQIPELQGLTPVYFVALKLTDAGSRLISRNFYWLSTKAETLDWDHSTWWYTPTATFADFTGLEHLPAATLQPTTHVETSGPWTTVHVRIQNTSPAVSFFNRLEIVRDRDGEEVLPVFWSDNDVSLTPFESWEGTARVRTSDLAGQRPSLKILAWSH